MVAKRGPTTPTGNPADRWVRIEAVFNPVADLDGPLRLPPLLYRLDDARFSVIASLTVRPECPSDHVPSP